MQATDSTALTRLGASVKRLRNKKSLSQEAYAERCRLDRTYISLIERGRRNPSFTNLCKLARGLSVSPSQLLRGIAA